MISGNLKTMQIEDTRPVMVSIRCTVYNHEPYLRECLEGFVMQKTNFRFEAVVHDDVSTDGSIAIIKEYAERYPNIIKPIYETENQYSKKDGSLGRIMNNACKGKYIAFCEGDDYWVDPLKLQKQIDFLENNLDYSMSHTNNICYDQKKGIFVPEVSEYIKNEKGNNLTCEDVIKYPRIVMTLTVVMRSSVYELVNTTDDFIFNSGSFLLGDVPKWYTAARLGKVHYLKDVTSVYRALEKSASHIKGYRNRYSFAVSAQGLRAYLCRRDHLSSELSALVEKKYADVLLHHLVLNPQYKPIVPLLPNTCKFELSLHKYRVLGIYLLLKDMWFKIKRKL